MEHYSTPFFRLAKTRHIIAIHPPEAIADGVSLEICRAFASDGNAVMEHYSTPFFRLAKTRHISAIHPPEPMAAHLICRASAAWYYLDIGFKRS